MFLFKIFSAFSTFSGVLSLHNLLPLMLLDNDVGSTDSTKDMALFLMMAQNGHHGGHDAENQMSMMLPLVLLNKKSSTDKTSNSDLLLLMLMQQPNAVNSPMDLMPYIILKDDATGTSSTDMTTLFIASSMIQRSCDVDTNQGLQNMLPLLLLDTNSKDDNLMTMLMVQMMSPNANAVGLGQMLPYIMLMNNDKDNSNNLLTMVMLSSSMGGMGSTNGYNSNFNMLLPFALKDCTSTDDACKKQQRNMLVLLMAMQSSAPNSPMNSQQILPLLLMKDDSSNEQLIMFMTMLSQQPNCIPAPAQPVVITRPLPEPVVETIYREFKIDNQTGQKQLVRTSRTPMA